MARSNNSHRFLFSRIQRSGSDSRFDEIKKSPTQFAGAWFLQGCWVSLTALPVFAVSIVFLVSPTPSKFAIVLTLLLNAPPSPQVNAIPAHLQPRLGLRDALAAAMWISAFAYEVTADRQKSAWRAKKDNKEHDEKFISSGLWAQSRHPK